MYHSGWLSRSVTSWSRSPRPCQRERTCFLCSRSILLRLGSRSRRAFRAMAQSGPGCVVERMVASMAGVVASFWTLRARVGCGCARWSMEPKKAALLVRSNRLRQGTMAMLGSNFSQKAASSWQRLMFLGSSALARLKSSSASALGLRSWSLRKPRWK